MRRNQGKIRCCSFDRSEFWRNTADGCRGGLHVKVDAVNAESIGAPHQIFVHVKLDLDSEQCTDSDEKQNALGLNDVKHTEHQSYSVPQKVRTRANQTLSFERHQKCCNTQRSQKKNNVTFNFPYLNSESQSGC
jgi:hypothetical protein